MRFNQSNKTNTAVWFLSFAQVELPATLAGIWLLDCAGRKKTTLALFLLLGPDARVSVCRRHYLRYVAVLLLLLLLLMLLTVSRVCPLSSSSSSSFCWCCWCSSS